MHFGVCFFCVLLVSESFVTTMPSFRNVLEPQQIKDKNSEDFYTAPQIILPEGSMPDSAHIEGDYNSLYKSLHSTSNAGKSPISEYHESSNKAVSDDSASFPSLFLENPKFNLNSLSKRTERRNVRKEDYSSAFVHDRSTNNITPMNKLQEPDVQVEGSGVTNLASEVKQVPRGTTNLKNISSIMSPEMVKPVDDKLRKSNEKGQNILLDRKLERRQRSTSMDEVASGFGQRVTSQLNYQENDEQHPLDDGEQHRGSLRRKQRNTGVFWRKRDMPVLGYDTSGMLPEPEDENFLQKDMYGLESSTQYPFMPNPRDISYVNGRDTYFDMSGINSLDVNEEYVPNLPLNSIQGNVAVQNDLPFQLPRPYNHNYQRFSSLTNSANDIPSNTYLTANSYQSEVVPELPVEPSDYLLSSSSEDTMSFNKYLADNDNIGFKSQEVQPHEGEIKYRTENHDKDYEKKYSYNDEMSNILNQNDLSIYPGPEHNSYLGDSVASDLSDSYPSEREKQFSYNNYRKPKYFYNNNHHRDYSSNRDSQEKYVEVDNNIDSDSEVPNSVEQKYSYNFPGTLGEISDSKNYKGISPQILHNPDINEIETKDSDVFSPMNFMSQSKSDVSSPNLGHFSSYVTPAITDSTLPRNSHYDFQSNIRNNLFKRYKYPRKYFSMRRNSHVSPYTQDDEFAEFHPMKHRTQDSMLVYDCNNSDNDESQISTKTQRKSSENETQTSPTDSPMAPTKNSSTEKSTSTSALYSRKSVEDTFDPLKALEEEEHTEAELTETTTLPPDTESFTEEELKKEEEHDSDEENANRTSKPVIHNVVPVCKTADMHDVGNSSSISSPTLGLRIMKEGYIRGRNQETPEDIRFYIDFPCSVDGVWYSHTGGVLLSLKSNKDIHLHVQIHNTPAYYRANGILSECWNITGELPFYPRMKSFITLKATEHYEHKVATFLGECFTCEGVDVIYGSWLVGRPAHSCSDQHISTVEYKDVFKKSHLHGLGINFQKSKRKPNG